MIGIILSSLLFLFILISTFSLIPPTLLHKFLSLFSQNPPPPTKKPTSSNHAAAASAAGGGGVGALRGVFATFDKNCDGYITKQELLESLNSIGLRAGERDVTDMVERVDSNGDGLIDMDEFSGLLDSLSGRGEEEEEDGPLKEAFDVFDGNRDGLISVDELGLVLSSLGFSEGRKMEDCKEMIRKVDVDGDGMVNFDEFKRMMKTGLIGSFFPVS